MRIMTAAVRCLIGCLAISTIVWAESSSVKTAEFATQYLGLKPPGMTPEVFAPGLFSTDAFEMTPTLSPDLKELFFVRRPTFEGYDNRIYYSRFENNAWTPPVRAPFSTDIMEMLPCVSHDGRKILFDSDRPWSGDASLNSGIWVSERTPDGWSVPEPVNAPIAELHPMRSSIAANGTIYFGGRMGRKLGVFRTQPVNGRYSTPECISDSIKGGPIAHPFIAPDESYLLFDVWYGEGGIMNKSKLRVSFRRADGSWGPATDFGPEINKAGTEMIASVSPDGKYLFFTRTVDKNGDIYWVDARILEALRPEGTK